MQSVSLSRQHNFTGSVLVCDPRLCHGAVPDAGTPEREGPPGAPAVGQNGPWWRTYTFGVITGLRDLETEVRTSSKARLLLQSGELASLQG